MPLVASLKGLSVTCSDNRREEEVSGVEWRLGSREERCLKRSETGSEVEPGKAAGNLFFHECLNVCFLLWINPGRQLSSTKPRSYFPSVGQGRESDG